MVKDLTLRILMFLGAHVGEMYRGMHPGEEPQVGEPSTSLRPTVPQLFRVGTNDALCSYSNSASTRYLKILDNLMDRNCYIPPYVSISQIAMKVRYGLIIHLLLTFLL